ncbi:MAG: C40 family peptidase [Deltaproteobacteria bacterium]|nr:C40 family peptidase [Deltaproteobacteria bacterium]
MRTAFSQIGNLYRYGGISPDTGFDCSGFVSWVYKQYGVDLPRSSREMLKVGVSITREELRPGDLVFFNYGYSHVGIYTGDNQFIHSPSRGKRIQESNLYGRGYTEHYVGARRIIDNHGVDFISEKLKAQWVQQSRHQTTLAMNDAAAKRHTGANATYQTTQKKKKKKNNSRTQTASGSTNSERVYSVASGDTLVDVAKRHGVTTSSLVAYNQLPNANKIKPGQTLKIPSVSSEANKTASNVNTSKNTSQNSAKNEGQTINSTNNKKKNTTTAPKKPPKSKTPSASTEEQQKSK